MVVPRRQSVAGGSIEAIHGRTRVTETLRAQSDSMDYQGMKGFDSSTGRLFLWQVSRRGMAQTICHAGRLTTRAPAEQAQITLAAMGKAKAPLSEKLSANHPTIAGPARTAR